MTLPLLAAVATADAVGPPPASAASSSSSALEAVVVMGRPGGAAIVRDAVLAAGGQNLRELAVIDGFAADLPAGASAALMSSPAITSITSDTALDLTNNDDADGDNNNNGDNNDGDNDNVCDATSTKVDKLDPKEPFKDRPGALPLIRAAVGATTAATTALSGAGIDVAVIDSGVVDHAAFGNRLIHGPDLSSDNAAPALSGLDTFGHGTHIASIVAGQPAGDFEGGIAPGARVISLKVADATGASDVSQVLAAIDWVIQFGQTDGRNIRVLNLSLGTDTDLTTQLDPLSYAAENAWRHGIVVVAAAGNHGDKSGRLLSPAANPYVIAVGALDTKQTVTPSDDEGLKWSGKSKDNARASDLAAPARSVEGLRVNCSWLDANNKDARRGQRIRGSGTSQAAAVTSGVVALLLEARPSLTPDEVKGLLIAGAAPIKKTHERTGAGSVNLAGALNVAKSGITIAPQRHAASTGTGSLEQARGTQHIEGQSGRLEGEITAAGTPWDAAAWAGASWQGASWQGASWQGASWQGASWQGASWQGASWQGASWQGASWQGASWQGASWQGGLWSTSFWD